MIFLLRFQRDDGPLGKSLMTFPWKDKVTRVSSTYSLFFRVEKEVVGLAAESELWPLTVNLAVFIPTGGAVWWIVGRQRIYEEI